MTANSERTPMTHHVAAASAVGTLGAAAAAAVMAQTDLVDSAGEAIGLVSGLGALGVALTIIWRMASTQREMSDQTAETLRQIIDAERAEIVKLRAENLHLRKQVGDAEG